MVSLIESYQKRCRADSLEENNLQLDLLRELGEFNKTLRPNLIKKISMLLNSNSNKNCFYIYGTVGVGKTLIMDLFYNNINAVSYTHLRAHET